jgi:hypothetical protein
MGKPVTETMQAQFCEAMAAIETVLDDRPDKIYQEISDAVCSLIRVRDRLIEEQRAGDSSIDTDEWLHRINGVISATISIEYPLAGTRWQRVKMVHDGLKQALAATPTER